MADIKQAYANNASLTVTLDSLANGSGRCSTAVDNSTNLYIASDIRVKIVSGSSGVSASGYVSVYLVRSDDGTNYDDAFGGTDAALTPNNAYWLGDINVTANSTTYHKVFDTQELGITLSKKWAIAVVNNSGAALGTGNTITHTQKYLTSI